MHGQQEQFINMINIVYIELTLIQIIGMYNSVDEMLC